jgi:phosphotransferase system HPr (HPr) family protein
MLKQTLNIVNKLGLHARAAAKLVKLASTFECEVQVKRKQREVNGKSIMGVMLLAAGKGTEVEVTVDGTDEINAMAQLSNLIQSGFGEEE